MSGREGIEKDSYPQTAEKQRRPLTAVVKSFPSRLKSVNMIYRKNGK